MNYHGQMINIRIEPGAWDQAVGANTELTYRMGHRDARHAAAEIANEADGAIELLTGKIIMLKAAQSALAAERDALTQLTTDLLAENAGLKNKIDRLVAELADITMVELAALKGE